MGTRTTFAFDSSRKWLETQVVFRVALAVSSAIWKLRPNTSQVWGVWGKITHMHTYPHTMVFWVAINHQFFNPCFDVVFLQPADEKFDQTSYKLDDEHIKKNNNNQTVSLSSSGCLSVNVRVGLLDYECSSSMLSYTVFECSYHAHTHTRTHPHTRIHTHASTHNVDAMKKEERTKTKSRKTLIKSQ